MTSKVLLNEVLTELRRRLDPEPRRHQTGYPGTGMDYLSRVPAITCADGFRMSVQASYLHYCTPRDSYGSWYEVEVGFPSERVEALMPYIDDDEGADPTETVYGYFPIDVVAQVIVDHGGFASGEAA